jgi:acyl-CoA thioester hydrolase
MCKELFTDAIRHLYTGKNTMSTKKPAFISQQKVRWGDMDAFGHINNTLYFRYLEQARFEWMEHLEAVLPQGQAPVLITANCTFLRQIKYPATLEVRIFVEAIGRSSTDLRYEIVQIDQPDVICSEATTKVVWADLSLGKSCPIPDVLRQLLEESK